MDKVTRIEVIDSNGRAYSNWRVKEHELSYQDGGKTLKIFIKEHEKHKVNQMARL